jgi:hypothetical protein
MTTPSKRFQLVPGMMNMHPTHNDIGAYGLMIEDFAWWMDNERDILNWMVDNMPQGIDHQQGVYIYFPADRDRIGFLLRWS